MEKDVFLLMLRKKVPGKPIECSFKQNPDRQMTDFPFLEGIAGRLRKRGT